MKQVRTPTFEAMINEMMKTLIPLRNQATKVECLFSTCTQNANFRMLTQETLERDQGINKREERNNFGSWKLWGKI